MGRGSWKNAEFIQYQTNSIIPRGKTDAIVYGNGVQLSTIPASKSLSVLDSSTSLKVTFNTPEIYHGSSPSSYLLEWWEGDYTQASMEIHIQADTTPSGTFRLKYDGDITDYLSVNSNADVIRTALESLAGIRSVEVTVTKVGPKFDTKWSIKLLQDFPKVDLEIDNQLIAASLIANVKTTGTSSPKHYDSTVIEASDAISSYTYVLTNLIPGKQYRARVSSVNAEGISIGQISSPLDLAPPRQKPSEPLDVSLYTYSSSALKVLYRMPESDGGDLQGISKYKIEWDLNEHFNSSAGGPAGSHHMVVTTNNDCSLSHCEYLIRSLETGVPYHVRVFSYNSFGYSELAGIPTEIFGIPMTQPDPPSAVSVTSTEKQTLLVSIQPPPNDGGANVTEYKVEWDVLGAEAYDTVDDSTKSLLYSPYNVQVIQSKATSYSLQGYFYIQFNGFSTDSIKVDALAIDVETALQALPTVGDVTVVRTENKDNFGYDWTITFLNSDWFDTTTDVFYSVPSLSLSNLDSDLPSAYVSQIKSSDLSSTFLGETAVISTKVLVTAMAGYAQQSLTVSVSLNVGLSPSDDVKIGGTYILTYGIFQTAPMSVSATSHDIEMALSSIEGLGQVIVKRQAYVDDNGNPGITLYFIFIGNLGSVESIGMRSKNIVTSIAGYSVHISHNNIVSGTTPILGSEYYKSAVVSANPGGPTTYEITNVDRGLHYHIRVSAWNGAGNIFGPSQGCIPALHRPVVPPILGDTLNMVNLNDDSIEVSWFPPSNVGGHEITEYMIDYDYAPAVAAVQSITIQSSSNKLSGSFCLSYEGFSTSTIPYDASETRLESALESLANIGNVLVHRDVHLDNNYGITWLVTFVDNVGILSRINFSCNNLLGDSVSVKVDEVTPGQPVSFKGGSVGIITKPLGSVSLRRTNAVQKITVNATSTDLHGEFYVYNAGELSMPIDVYSSAEDVQLILEDMLTIDD